MYGYWITKKCNIKKICAVIKEFKPVKVGLLNRKKCNFFKR